MDLQLTNKKALVTGSTAGIGFAIAKHLASEGVIVTINGRTQQRIDDAIANIRKDIPFANVSGIVADFQKEEDITNLTKQLPEVDILINNVAVFNPQEFVDIPDEEWQRFFDINIMSGVRLSRFYLPKMLSKNWGRIIFISSESALNIPEEMVHYGMTKTAQLAISRGIAETTRGTNVTVNSVLPGPTSSEGVSEFVDQLAQSKNMSKADMEKEFFHSARPSSILQRFTTPEEIANLVVYVASPLSSATNGAALRADGGVYKSI
jgi:NAD(P)-dependent dehydrogenase (short-subunit alcohol dehydrogenase family)